jgi:hypothetical protein
VDLFGVSAALRAALSHQELRIEAEQQSIGVSPTLLLLIRCGASSNSLRTTAST